MKRIGGTTEKESSGEQLLSDIQASMAQELI
jgi:hypothetical protein